MILKHHENIFESQLSDAIAQLRYSSEIVLKKLIPPIPVWWERLFSPVTVTYTSKPCLGVWGRSPQREPEQNRSV
jgi:hypothetical protein